MRTIHRYLLLAAASTGLMLIGADALAQRPNSMEIVQLPRFCWSQYDVPDVKGDDFRIIDCGPAANHYCSSLLYVIRAKRQSNKNIKFNMLSSADIDLHYTEKAIAPYPSCNIREHVQAARVQLEELMRVYGYNRPRAKF